MIEGEDINFPTRPAGIPKEYFGAALHASIDDLVQISGWVIGYQICERGLILDINGIAKPWSLGDWENFSKVVTHSANKQDISNRIKMNTCRYYFARKEDAVEFKLRFG